MPGALPIAALLANWSGPPSIPTLKPLPSAPVGMFRPPALCVFPARPSNCSRLGGMIGWSGDPARAETGAIGGAPACEGGAVGWNRNDVSACGPGDVAAAALLSRRGYQDEGPVPNVVLKFRATSYPPE